MNIYIMVDLEVSFPPLLIISSAVAQAAPTALRGLRTAMP